MTNREKRKKRVAAYKATPIWERAHGNFQYCFHLDQGGRHGGLADGRHDWAEGCDNYYANTKIGSDRHENMSIDARCQWDI